MHVFKKKSLNDFLQLEFLHHAGEVFGCVLSLFMGCENQALPREEEVVVCNENTTSEEVRSHYSFHVHSSSDCLVCMSSS